MYLALKERAVEWDGSDEGHRGVAGFQCVALRKTEERDCIIETVDQFSQTVHLFDRVEKDVFTCPMWQLLKFEEIDNRLW